MTLHKFFLPFLTLSIFTTLFTLPLQAQNTWKVNSDYWSATDALGRKTPLWTETGEKREGKYVAMFYWTWHTDMLADWLMPDGSVANITEIINNNPGAEDNPDDPAWQNVWDGGVFWWDEPLFGYYRTTDEWILRKHAEMLADAGVDAVFFDCTNGSYTWKTSYTKLLQVWDQARKDGVKTPQIAFMLPFWPSEGALASISELYTELYQPGLYKDLWFIWKEKPIIMAYPEILDLGEGDTAGMRFNAVDTNFIAIDVTCPSWSNDIGNLTLRLYKWNFTYNSTVSNPAIAETTFVNFTDNARLTLSFEKQEPGLYLCELSEATETVGVWKYTNETDNIISFFNGDVVSGDYQSGIYYTTGYEALTSGNEHVPIQINSGVPKALRNSMRTFFTFRPGQPDYVNGPSRIDQWGWLENYPQHGYVNNGTGSYEQVTVGIGQNATDLSGGHCNNFNAPGSYGRSYTQTNGQDTSANGYLYGANFQEQWGRAFELDPELVFITGWNEWTAGRWKNWPGCAGNPEDMVMGFPDQYSWDKSRDIEPVKAWGNQGDVYYIQLVNNVRKFKGMAKPDTASPQKSINMQNFDDWKDVKPEFWHYKGNTMHRDHAGQGNLLHYVNNTGRNDIVLAKVARDSAYLYFYVQTAEDMTPSNDPNWMRLFIDTDRDKDSGWEGYDFVMNRLNPADSIIVEKNEHDWSWTKAGTANYLLNGNQLAVRVRRRVLGLQNSGDIDLEFKWSDNSITDGNIMDFYVNGDAAPGGRFNFVYTTKVLSSINENTGELDDFRLEQNYPNPFNPKTRIEYTLPQNAFVEITIYNLNGQKIKTVESTRQNAGSHLTEWNALDENGQRVASGVYFYKLKAYSPGKNYQKIRKMVLLK